MVRGRVARRPPWMPPQAAPVRRPDVIAPHTVVDVVHGDLESLIAVRIELMHGANFNDPPRYQAWSHHQLRASGRQ